MTSKILNYLSFKSFEFDRTRGVLFQKRVVCTKLDIYVFITGNNLEPFAQEKTSQSNDTTCLEMDSHELQQQTILQSISASEIKSHSYTKFLPTLHILPPLSLYISGRKRIASGRKISSRVMCALASDKLVGNPLHSFLCRKGQDKEKKLLEFWTDIRQYLDAEDGHRDEVGNPIKQKLANMIFSRYLSSSTKIGELFSEKIKLMVYRHLSERDDEAIFNFAQEFVTEVSFQRFIIQFQGYIKNIYVHV